MKKKDQPIIKLKWEYQGDFSHIAKFGNMEFIIENMEGCRGYHPAHPFILMVKINKKYIGNKYCDVDSAKKDVEYICSNIYANNKEVESDICPKCHRIYDHDLTCSNHAINNLCGPSYFDCTDSRNKESVTITNITSDDFLKNIRFNNSYEFDKAKELSIQNLNESLNTENDIIDKKLVIDLVGYLIEEKNKNLKLEEELKIVRERRENIKRTLSDIKDKYIEQMNLLRKFLVSIEKDSNYQYRNITRLIKEFNLQTKKDSL